MRAAARAALDLLGVAVPVDAPVGAIGVAQRQLVAIARALHFGARLIILDEPTSSLSLGEVEALLPACAACARAAPPSSTSRTAWRSCARSRTA